jgi:hypothetical protein
MQSVKKLEEKVAVWPHLSIHTHRFGGREFRFGDAEVGHVHRSGMIDIPFPRPIHDALLAEGLPEKHPWVPDSGWVTFRIRSEQDLKHALWLMRLSLLRYLLKAATDPRQLLQQESEELRLSPRFQSLFEPLAPKPAKQVSREPLPGVGGKAFL